MIEPATLATLISYDATTGALTWLPRPERLFKSVRDCRAWNTMYAGKPALGARHGAGYRHGSVMGGHVLAHRAAWAITHGVWPAYIDHINGDRSDNRLSNLRAVTASENSRNQGLQKRNKSGVNGVHKRSSDGRYLVNILHGGKTKFIGLYATIGEAAAARKAAERLLGYHPTHGSARAPSGHDKQSTGRDTGAERLVKSQPVGAGT